MSAPPPPVWILDRVDDAEGLLDPEYQHQVGLVLPDSPWDLSQQRIVCVGVVRTSADAATAITAVARGAGVAIAVELAPGERHRLLQDLERTRMTAGPSPRPATAWLAALSADQRTLLDALVDGSTVTAAAARLHVSRRTANRLLAEARSTLGVSTNAEAVDLWSARL